MPNHIIYDEFTQSRISRNVARKLAGVVPVKEFAEGRYVLMVRRKSVIKKTSLADFQNIRSNGIIAINIDEGDELLNVVLRQAYLPRDARRLCDSF